MTIERFYLEDVRAILIEAAQSGWNPDVICAAFDLSRAEIEERAAFPLLYVPKEDNSNGVRCLDE